MARKPLADVTRSLTAVCMGREPADLVVTGGRLVNVHTREVLDGADVAIGHGRVAMFGDVSHTRGPETEVVDAAGAYLVPGLVDTHLHVESVMLTVTRFAEAVLPHGTTAAFIDNHEMANVFGLEGMRWMLEEGRDLPLKVFLAVPSCVPALPGFEDAGAALGRGKPATGHWSLTGWRDNRLQAYAAAGVDSCPETTTREDALAKLRTG